MAVSGFSFHTTAREVIEGIDLSSRQVVLTGASSGIGVETARALALAGAELVVGVRDVAKGEAALADIAAKARGGFQIKRLELSDPASVIAFAKEISGPVDVLIANAVLPGSSLTGLQRYHGEALKRKIGFIREDGSLDERMKTHQQAAATSVWAATAPELEGRGGLVLEDCAEALAVGPDTHPWAGYDASVADPETARALWEHSLALVETLLGCTLKA